jgi:hypothetical protein
MIEPAHTGCPKNEFTRGLKPFPKSRENLKVKGQQPEAGCRMAEVRHGTSEIGKLKFANQVSEEFEGKAEGGNI